MLTRVILEGPLGKQFGREWKLAVSSPREALSLIDANKPGVFAWIRANLEKYSRYRVIIENDGVTHELTTDEYHEHACDGAKTIRFVPIIEGAGGNPFVRFVIGAALLVVGVFTGNPYLVAAGASLMLGSIVQMFMSTPKKDTNSRVDKTSRYFDGPTNTTQQGVPVPLIYGKSLVGSHVISVSLTVDQVGTDQ